MVRINIFVKDDPFYVSIHSVRVRQPYRLTLQIHEKADVFGIGIDVSVPLVE